MMKWSVSYWKQFRFSCIECKYTSWKLLSILYFTFWKLSHTFFFFKFIIIFFYFTILYWFCHKIWAEQSIKWSLKEWKEQIPKLNLIIEDVIQSLKIPSSSWWVRISTSEFSLICSTVQVTEIRLCCISVIKPISNKKSQLFWK